MKRYTHLDKVKVEVFCLDKIGSEIECESEIFRIYIYWVRIQSHLSIYYENDAKNFLSGKRTFFTQKELLSFIMN